MKKTADEGSARELYLTIENDGDLYRRQHQPIMQNLVQKIDRGVYDREKAIKLYMYLVQSGAEKYVKDFGSHGDKWFEMFDKPTRELVAKNFVANFEAEYKLGNFTNETYHKKKYRGKEGMLKNPGKTTFVFNLKTGEEKYYTLPPKEAVVAAFEQSIGNNNTWDYNYGKCTVSKSGGTVSCGDWAAILDKAKAGSRVKKNPAKGKGSYAFDVYLGKKNIDTIFQGQMTGTKAEMEEDVKRSLVNHDGYDSSITVRRRPAGK